MIMYCCGFVLLLCCIFSMVILVCCCLSWKFVMLCVLLLIRNFSGGMKMWYSFVLRWLRSMCCLMKVSVVLNVRSRMFSVSSVRLFVRNWVWIWICWLMIVMMMV